VLAALLLAGIGAEAAVDTTVEKPVVVELTAGAPCAYPGGATAGPGPDATAEKEKRIEIAPGATVERFARPPRDAWLRFAVAPDARERLRVTVASDATAENEVAVESDSSAEAGAAWQGKVPYVDGEPIRLRFENRGSEPIALAGARLEGTGAEASAPIAAFDSSETPNVVVYLIDALRPDRLSVYGYERETSPNIDAVARRGVLFANAYAPGPSTLHSLPALLSSRHASDLWALREHGGADWTLAERLRAAGFQTAAFQANPWVRPGLGFARGFDVYEMVHEKNGARAPATKVNERALAWLRERDRERPFFLFLQTLDVHTPYEPPEDLREKFAGPERPKEPRVRRPLSEIGRGVQAAMVEIVGGDPEHRDYLDPARYDAAVAYADRELGRFLEVVAGEASRPTILVITADHGESLGNLDDGTYVHGHSLYEEQVRVPLIVWIPGKFAAGVKASDPVSLLDLAPTILDAARAPIPPDARGRSLLRAAPGDCPPAAVGVLLEEALDVQPTAQMERPRPIAEWFVREGPWKLLGGKENRLFHLPTDPLEQNDRSAERPILTAYLDARAATVREKPATAAAATTPAKLPESERREVERALRSLGYVE